MKQVLVKPPKGEISLSLVLPASKSLSNRALIINQLAQNKGQLYNLSQSSDTKVLISALQDLPDEINVYDAGTAMRFLTAYLAIQEGKEHILTGTQRMQQRPIGPLVDALRTLGADITYLEQEGYPPLRINGQSIQGGSLRVKADESSQYISALLMIAPVLKKGLQLQLDGQAVSTPYIRMTIALMAHFGVAVSEQENLLEVAPTSYQSRDYHVEADWSAASYWYEMLALSSGGNIILKGLSKQSLQGDAAIADLMQLLGVQTMYEGSAAILSKSTISSRSSLNTDFRDIPDLLPALAATCGALNVSLKATGVHHLRLKETDRLEALKQELAKVGCEVILAAEHLTLQAANSVSTEQELRFHTYKDHRMAMCLAPLALVFGEVAIEEPDVVQKSYPDFWNHLQQAGFELTFKS